jgi:2-succinyl-5-enolpyruvyl-6-hydroxy-3-cyclohexene-1-carboxylate synthase
MVSQESSSINSLWAQLIVQEFLRNKTSQFVLSPGSRCTPLTAAVAAENNATVTMHFDERGAAYFALGYARATGRPAVLVCTSGTAAANYYPAVVEASMDRVPLILLTADRPPELLECGANQTIDQVNLYGKYVRFHFELPCPDLQIAPEVVLTLVDQAVYRTLRSPRGPVHLNCMFREPLAPTPSQQEFSKYLSNTKKWINGDKPFTSYEPPVLAVDHTTLEQLADNINSAAKGLLLIGSLNTAPERECARRLSQKLNWPTFTDIRSGLRLGRSNRNIISYFDQLLLSETFKAMLPSTVIHLGGSLTSKRLELYFEQNPPELYIHVADHPCRHDPCHRVSARIESHVDRFGDRLLPLLKTRPEDDFLKQLKHADNAAGEIIEGFIENDSAITEPAVARIVSSHIAKDSCLFLGNSMPIRDMDMYADPSGPRVNVAANRGASGIDGNIAAAAGFVHSAQVPGTLVIGDLACLHDLNSLDLLNKISNPLTVIVVNNDGGGIFSFLPVAECREIFEPFFATPHNLTFEKVAETFKLDYYQPRSKLALVENYKNALDSNRSAIIEVHTDRNENLAIHKSLQDKIRVTIDNLL